jgi:hypothetical protein
MRCRMIVISALVVQLPLTLAFGQQHAAEKPLAGAASAQVPAGGSGSNEGPRQPERHSSSCQQLDGAVVVRDARVSIHAADQSLAMLLDAVARCLPPLAIRLATELEDDRVSIAFADVPIDEGLRRVLHTYDAFFYYAGAASSHVLEGLWVFPRGQGGALAPLDTVAWGRDADTEARLSYPDRGIRVRALEALIERRGEAAMDHVLTALADPDAVVRAQVLDLAFSNGLPIPPDRWSALALSDPSALIRLQVLQNAPDGPELASIAEVAQNDPDPYVQMEAKAILARVAAAAGDSANGRRVPRP